MSSFVEPYLARAGHDVSVGALGSALVCIEAALEVAPMRSRLLLDRAALHAALGRTERAQKDVDLALEIAPADRRGLVLRALLLEASAPLAARAALDEALRVAPHYREALIERTSRALKDADLRTAVRLMAVAVDDRLDEIPAMYRGLGLERLSPEEGRWLALGPDLATVSAVYDLSRARHRAAFAGIDAARNAEKMANLLETSALDTTNVAEVWASIADMTVPCRVPDAFIARVTSAHAVIRERVFAVSLAASAKAQLDGRFVEALDHTRRALDVAPTALRATVKERRDLLAHGAASVLAAEAEALLAVDVWRADARARRAVELDPTPEHRALEARTACLAGESQAAYVKTLGARRDGQYVIVWLQLGGDDGSMPAAPGCLSLTVNDVTTEHELTADDYQLVEVVVGGAHVGWERTWTSDPFRIPRPGAKIAVRFAPAGGRRVLEATKTLGD